MIKNLPLGFAVVEVIFPGWKSLGWHIPALQTIGLYIWTEYPGGIFPVNIADKAFENQSFWIAAKSLTRLFGATKFILNIYGLIK